MQLIALLKKLFRRIPWLYRVSRSAYALYYRTAYQICNRIYSTDPYHVYFDAYWGKSYACSPKALYEAMLADPAYREYRFTWALTDPSRPRPWPDTQRTTLVTWQSLAQLRAMASAGTIITNSLLPEYVCLKSNQKLVETWHGTPLKRLGCDIHVHGDALNTVESIHQRYRQRASRFDALLSPSPFCSEKLASAFDLAGLGKLSIIIEAGYPRNDRLCRYSDHEIDALRAQLKISAQKGHTLCPYLSG